MDEKIVARMNELAPLNFEKCGDIANEFGVKQRAVVASASRLGIEYTRKARVSKTGEPVVSKGDLVARIADVANLDASALEGLEKATKAALSALAEALEAQADDEVDFDADEDEAEVA